MERTSTGAAGGQSPRHFLRLGPDRAELGVWEITDKAATQLGVSPKGAPGTFFAAKPGESVWDAMRRETPWFDPGGSTFHEIKLSVGQYYPRIIRPFAMQLRDSILGESPGHQTERDVVATTVGQLIALMRQLDRICQTIHPSPETLDTYGHDIRNLLILACTEVETNWRGILSKNGVSKRKLTTNDYVQLSAAMRLPAYSVSFLQYPWLSPLAPFTGWGTTGSPTKELRWYDAYNKVKHDRENQFRESTLRHALEAVTACFVMVAAQFGFTGLRRTEVQSFFQLEGSPTWEPEETYIPTYGRKPYQWTPVSYPFAP